jgi:dTMP kinase
MKTGKLIVIEGTDGSGKATQTELLANRLRQQGRLVEVVDFPQYDNFSAAFVAKYLQGEYGTADEVGPYRASIFFALDRYDKSFEIRRWLEEGKMVIANRYVSANMGHQAGKIRNPKKRAEFLAWLANLEYKIFAIPKPALTIFLYVPPAVGQRLVDKKVRRAYTKGKKRDIHEADFKHLQNASRAYLEVAKKYRWRVINGTDSQEQLLPREVISDQIFAIVKKYGGGN